MSILNAISNAFKGKKAPDSAKISELLAQAENETATARQRLAELEAQRPEMALADEADRRRFRAELAETREFVEGGEDAIVALRDKHAAAVEAEAEDGRKKAYKAAKSKADELPGLIDEYEKAAQAVRDVVARIAEIDAVVRTANADLPAGVSRISDSGALRSVPAQPREIVSEKTVHLWVREGHREPASELIQDKVQQESSGKGWYHPEGGYNTLRYDKLPFIRREYREAATAVHAAGFDKLSLPAAYAAKSKTERAVAVEFIPLKAAA